MDKQTKKIILTESALEEFKNFKYMEKIYFYFSSYLLF